MNKGLIRKFASVGITLACALVMTATLPGCASCSKCHKAGCTKNCDKPCGKKPCDSKTPCNKKS